MDSVASQQAHRAAGTPVRWHLRLLGAVELVNASGLPVRLPTRAVTLLLARLAMAPRAQHPREELVELLWPQAEPEVARNRLRQVLSVLRSLLLSGSGASGLTPPLDAEADVLQADRRAVWLAPDVLSSDVHTFNQAWTRKDWRAAAAIYQGELLPGHFDEWVLEERAQLANRVERAWAQSAQLSSLDEPSDYPRQLPAAATADVRLPRYLTRLVGFEAEGAALSSQVLQHRLVTLRGPGGAGKTRLAVEVAWSLAQPSDARLATGGSSRAAFDQVAFVPLASCTSTRQLVDTLLHTLRLQGDASAAGTALQLAAALAGRRVLLLLDNFEQLVPVARDELAQWLSELPELHVLVTSRHALDIDGEVEVLLQALPLPAAQAPDHELGLNPAVALFAERARATRGDGVLNNDGARQVADIVKALHGLPLAIELAAARLRTLDLASLHRLLVQGQAAKTVLPLLERSGPRAAADPRHASMLQVLQDSWDLLSPSEQDLLATLAACEGGAGLALLSCLVATLPGAPSMAADIRAADAVVAAAAVDRLVAASVVLVQADAAGTHRYAVFEPLREFIFMKVGAAGVAQLRGQHSAAVSMWAAAQLAATDQRPAEQAWASTQELVRAEWGNLMRALESGADTEISSAPPEQALDLALNLRRLLDEPCLGAGALAELRRAVDLAAPGYRDGPVQSLLAENSFEAGQKTEAEQHALRALAATSAPGDRATVLRCVARVLMRLGHDLNRVRPIIDEAVQLAQIRGEWPTLALALSTRAVVLLRQSRDFQANLLEHQAIVKLMREQGPSRGLASALVGQALALGFLRRVPEQLVLLDEVRRRAAQGRQDRLLAFAHSVTGYALADQRRFAESAAYYQACLLSSWERASWREWFYALWNLPRTLAHLRRPAPAAQLMGFAERFYAQRFGVLGPEDRPEARRTRRLVAAQLGRDATELHWQQGATLTMAQAMQLAVAEVAECGVSIPRERVVSP